MPILRPEAAQFPEQLFADEVPLPELEQRAWWVLHTRPRQEKSVARDLHQRQVPFYLPLVAHRSRMRSRIMTSYLPLFPGYVFLLAGGEERLAALSTGRVVRTLPVAETEGLWRDLRQIHRLIASGSPLTREDRLAPGMKVEIKSGPLAGLKGTIIRGASGRRFVVAVDFIQQGASVLLDDFTLTQID